MFCSYPINYIWVLYRGCNKRKILWFQIHTQMYFFSYSFDEWYRPRAYHFRVDTKHATWNNLGKLFTKEDSTRHRAVKSRESFLSSIDTLEQWNYLRNSTILSLSKSRFTLSQSVKFFRIYLFGVALNLCKYSTGYLKEAKSILCIVGV